MIISAAKASEAAQVLGVSLQGLTPENLSRAYRGKSKECHPDYHGSTELDMWARVSWAKEVLVRWLERAERLATDNVAEVEGGCRACGGSGRIKLTSTGFGQGLTKMCLMCHGSGIVQPGTGYHGRTE